MATRKKANAVEPAIEQTREQPVIANDAPTLPVPSLNFAPASLERPIVSSVRPSSKGARVGRNLAVARGHQVRPSGSVGAVTPKNQRRKKRRRRDSR